MVPGLSVDEDLGCLGAVLDVVGGVVELDVLVGGAGREGDGDGVAGGGVPGVGGGADDGGEGGAVVGAEDGQGLGAGVPGRGWRQVDGDGAEGLDGLEVDGDPAGPDAVVGFPVGVDIAVDGVAGTIDLGVAGRGDRLVEGQVGGGAGAGAGQCHGQRAARGTGGHRQGAGGGPGRGGLELDADRAGSVAGQRGRAGVGL